MQGLTDERWPTMSKHGPFPLTHSVARNPWSGVGESMSSSASSQTYHVIPHQYIQVEGGHWGPPLVPPPPAPPPPVLSHLLPPPHHRLSAHEHHSRGTSSRAVTPQSCPTETVILPCGGHCVLFEQFCHRFLQVAFVGGILSGCILTSAGLVGSPELGVLAYIGALTALVSGLLLAVQARSRPRRRQRPPLREEIPLREVGRIPHQPPSVFREESGIPWWRRENMD